MKIKIKTIVRYHCIPTSEAKIKKTDIPSVSENEKHLKVSYYAGKSAIWQNHFVEVKILVCQYLLKLNTCILCDPAFPPVGMSPNRNAGDSV